MRADTPGAKEIEEEFRPEYTQGQVGDSVMQSTLGTILIICLVMVLQFHSLAR